MNTQNCNVCLPILFYMMFSLKLLIDSLYQQTQKHSLVMMGFFPDLQLGAMVTLKQVLLWR